MSFETTLTYSEPLIRQAVFSYWRRSVGFLFVSVLLAMTVWFIVMLTQGDKSWQVGVFGTVIGFGFFISGSIYVVQYKFTMAKFRAIGSPQSTFRADVSSFTFASGIGTSTLQWSTVKEIWQFQNVWLLLYSRGSFSMLPLANLSPELRAFVVERVQASGGKIK
jgi:hypothetical protein